MKNILIVAPYSTLPFDGYVSRFAYLAVRFAEEGFQTTLATSLFSHQQKRNHEKLEVPIDNLKIRLIENRAYASHVGMQRVLSLRDFSRNLTREISNLSQYDLVYSAYPSIRHNIAISRSIDRSKTKLVIDVQDVWPESFSSVIPAVSKVPPGFLPFASSANRAYAAADGIVAVSEAYLGRARVANKSSPGLVAYLGSEFQQENSTPSRSGPVRLFYIGTISYSYDIETIIRAVDELIRRGVELEFNVYGAGPELERLKSLPLAGTHFHGLMNYSSLEQELRQQHIAVNAIRAGAPQSITNKLCDYLSLGCPILNSQSGEEVRNILSGRLSSQYNAGDTKSAVDAISNLLHSPLLYGEWHADRNFSRSKIFQDILDFTRRLAG